MPSEAPVTAGVQPRDIAGAAPAGQRLRVAILLDSSWVPAWVDHVLVQIQQSTWASVILVLKDRTGAENVAAGSPGAGNRLLDWWVALDDRLFSQDCQPDALVQTTVDSRLVGIEETTRATEWSPVDVLLDFRTCRTAVGLAPSPRLGVWRVRPGMAPDGGELPGYRQVLGREPLTASVLERTDDGVHGLTALDVGLCRTDERSMRRNANQACWQSAGLMLGALRNAAEHNEGGELKFRATALEMNTDDRPPGTAQVLCGLADLAGHAFKSKVGATLYRERWGIAFNLHPGLPGPVDEVATLVYVKPPKDRTWADPFVVKRGDRHFVFFEDLLFATNKGRIAFLEISPSGTWHYGGVVLEHEHHMSYPFLFTWQNELYMVPEEGASDSVRLYRCVRFPDRWELASVLLDGIRAVDATLFQQGDSWWMFASMPTPGSSSDAECHLFHASQPMGPWMLHPSSPIKRDPRSARPAGALFWSGGNLFRPSQDCSIRYGGAISINRVLRFDGSRYEEESARRIEPTWRDDIVATHTLNSCDGATVIDVLFEDLRMSN